MRSVAIAVVSVSCLLWQACRQTPRPSAPEEDVLVRVGQWALTESDFRRELELRGLTSAPVAQKREVLESMVAFQILLHAAEQAGYASRPEVVEAMQRAMVTQYRRDHMTGLEATEVVSDEAVAARYTRDIDRYRLDDKVRGAVIVMRKAPATSVAERTAQRRLAEDIRDQAMRLDAGVFGFGELASQHSDDLGTRVRGGDVGWMGCGVAPSRWPRAVVETLCAMNPGEVSSVIDDGDALYLTKLVDRRAAGYRPLKAVAKSIRDSLIVEMKRDREEAMMSRAASSCRMERDEQRLSELWRRLERESREKAGPPAMEGSRDRKGNAS